MRFIEIKLSEATLQRTSTSSWEGYLEKLVKSENVGVGPNGEKAHGQKLSPASKEVIKSFIKQFRASKDDVRELKRLAAELEETEVTLLPNKLKVPVKWIHKSAEIKGGASTLTGAEKKPWNEGEVAETILGAALFARFTSKTDIKSKDVHNALSAFVKNVTPGGFAIANVKRNKKSPIDMKAFNKPLNNQTIDQYINDRASLEKLYPNGVKALDDKLEACAAYVNESVKVQQALEKADANPGAPIIIKTDGVGDQRGTKADLEIRIGEWEQLLSLKVNDVKQFGQDSGSSGAIISTFFGRFIPDLNLSDLYMSDGEPLPWNPEQGTGWPDMDNRKVTAQLKKDNLWDAALDQVYKLTGQAYQKAGDFLTDQISTPEGASRAVTNIYNGIVHHAQGGAQYQTLVILNPDAKTAWKELEFGPSLEDALANFRLEVKVDVAPGRGIGNHRLRIFGRPITPEATIAATTNIDTEVKAKKAKKLADTGKVREKVDPELLLQLRSYQQESGNMRNPVEMGPLLKTLTEVQKISDVASDNGVEDNVPVQQNKTTPTSVPTTNNKEPQLPKDTANEPPTYGQPSGMTNISPATSTLTQQPDEADIPQPDELDRVRKNAGIVTV